ncbi:hypothetical protein GO755_24760 [Spirosoma sp. HMF4905]|uniref:Uncharacterized protein n=1 Tax=Spirosoma arboris TaxID=2682092 RepID=A0A7K1SHN1_9BACT|nr:hypothetical protein [Spirosoma arboris]MVM33275.1 hypothetical protein [Spirosoma arboris]
MTNTDGLFLENVWVATADGIASTFQSNDLSKPTTLQISHTNTFSLADSIAIRQLTASAEQLDSASKWPYKTLRAKVVVRGETIFSGYAEFDKFSNGWDVTLFQEKKNLFDRLDRSIRTANLSRYDHDWTLEQVNLHAEATEGVCYPLVDYGLLSGNATANDTIFPAVYVKTLLTQLLYEEGYRLVGELGNDDLFKRLLIPFSESDPTSHDDQWSVDRKARVTWQAPTEEVDRGTLGSRYFIDRVQPYNLDNLVDQGFEQGKLHNYTTSSFSYVCDTAMRVRVQAFQAFKGLVVTGAIEVVLSVLVNGNEVANERFSEGAPYNILYYAIGNVTLDETIGCQAGDRIQIHLRAQRQTDLGAFRFTMYNDPNNSWASFTPDPTTHTGDRWPVARNLPDVTGLALLKGLAFLMGGTWSVDPFRRQVAFVSLSKIVNNTANAVDWSKRVDTGTEPGWIPRLEPYAQINYLTWKESDETKKAQVAPRGLSSGETTNYGNGVIRVDATTLDTDMTLFEMPFAASTDSDQSVPGYGNPPLIKIRTVSGSGSSSSINNQSTVPRLLLVALGDTQPMQTKRLKSDGITLEEVTVNLRPAWFGMRPNSAISNDTPFTLSFSSLLLNRGEQCIIDRYYRGLLRVLRRMRVLEVSVHLMPTDIASLDFERPIRLQRVRIGSLSLSDGLYYINKISDYVDGHACMVTLVAF